MVVAERLDIPRNLDALVGLAEHAERFADRIALPGPTRFALQLCLEEAVSNVIRHGGLADDARIGISLQRRERQFIVEITDSGVAFNPLLAPPPAPHQSLETATVGGRGIALLRHFCPDLTYVRNDGINCLCLAFPLDQAKD